MMDQESRWVIRDAADASAGASAIHHLKRAHKFGDDILALGTDV